MSATKMNTSAITNNGENTSRIPPSSFSERHEALLDTIATMRHQEARGYRVIDYLQLDQQQQQQHSRPDTKTPLHQQQQANPDPNGNNTPEQSPAIIVEPESRSKMVEWMRRVVDYCGFARESVWIAQNLLDRFLGTPAKRNVALARRQAAILTSFREYQLACMTCLYTTVKVHEPQAMTPQILCNISKGTYQTQEIEALEVEILLATQFRINPPTPHSYLRTAMEWMQWHVYHHHQQRQQQDVHHYDEDEDPILMVPLEDHAWSILYDMAKNQIEKVAMLDYALAQVPASVLAYCALTNALKSCCCVDTASAPGAPTAADNHPHVNGDKVTRLLASSNMMKELSRALLPHDLARELELSFLHPDEEQPLCLTWIQAKLENNKALKRKVRTRHAMLAAHARRPLPTPASPRSAIL